MVLFIVHFAKDGNVLGENMRKLGSPLDILKGQGFGLASLFTRDLTSGHVWPGSSDNGSRSLQKAFKAARMMFIDHLK